MSGADLRSFLQFVRDHSPREYVRLDRTISPQWELAAIVAKLEGALRAPIIECRQVSGTTLPVVTNVCASLSRIARSVGRTERELDDMLAGAYDRPIPPRIVADGAAAPVRHEVRRGAAVDLGWLPQMRYTEVETAPYLTATAVVARDPDGGTLNISYHRLMICDRATTGIFMAPGGHLHAIHTKNVASGADTPIAVFIGGHPLWSLGSLAAGGLELDEFGIIGALLGAPLEVVPGLLDGRLLVPASAEIVLEGSIRHDRHVDEGPFGEYAGYAMPRATQPVFEVALLSHRDQPVFQDIVAGRVEHLTMTGVALRAHLERALRRAYPETILELYLPAPMTLFLKLDKSRLAGRGVSELIREVLTSQPYLKRLVCFDPDVELRSLPRTQWAVATRTQIDRDLVVIPDQAGTGLDPSEREGRTTKWGLDATAKPDLAHYAARNRVPQHVLDRVDLSEVLGR
ncbi:MAG: hypothetical protein E6J20_01075 [Chloroflexi bacterium]|nr:MAG: hypothetical protein E6J20_01075 [Chloroflexota bacterium]